MTSFLTYRNPCYIFLNVFFFQLKHGVQQNIAQLLTSNMYLGAVWMCTFVSSLEAAEHKQHIDVCK